MIYLTRNVGTAIETLNNLLRFANSRARSSKTSSLFHPMCYRWKIKHSKPVWRHTACWHVLCWGGDSSYRYYRSYVTSPPYTPDENYFGPPEELVILCSNFSSSLLSSRNGCPVQSSSWTMISPYLQRPMLRTIWADIMILQRWFCYVGMWARCCQNWQIAFTINAVGNGLSPIDSLLLLCGIKVLALRMNRQRSTPSLIAKYLHSLRFHVTTLVLMEPRKRDPRTDHRQKWCSVELWTGSKLLSESIVAGVRPDIL